MQDKTGKFIKMGIAHGMSRNLFLQIRVISPKMPPETINSIHYISITRNLIIRNLIKHHTEITSIWI